MNTFSVFLMNAIVLCGSCWNYEDCVTLSGDIIFSINYEKKDPQKQGESIKAVHEVSIPTDSSRVTVTGACEAGNTGKTENSSLSLAWDGFKADFVFFKDTEKDHWYALTCQLSYSNTSIPDALNPKNTTLVRTTKDQELFLTRLTHYYQCNSSDSHPLYLVDENSTDTSIVTARMNTSNLVVKPFKSLKEAELCSKDTITPTKPPKPPTKPPKQPTPAPTTKPVTSGSKVAWTCTIVTVLVLCVCGIVIYHNKDGVPSYVRVV